jgi:alpha-beta hydrolase superfamily lysophospholipase
MQHSEGSFSGSRETKIYYQAWTPESTARAVLLLSHGFGEHSGRYRNLADKFVPLGYAVYALDHRGHGRSEGPRGQVESANDFIVDLRAFFDMVRERHPGLPIYLVGHSMGASIATIYASRYQHELAGLLLSGGGLISLDGDARPRRGPNDPVSRDPEVDRDYREDPLVYHGPQPEGDLAIFPKLVPEVAKAGPMLSLPVLIMAGEGAIVDVPRSKALLDAVQSGDKTLKTYPKLLHGIFREPEHPQVFADMEEWLEQRLLR